MHCILDMHFYIEPQKQQPIAINIHANLVQTIVINVKIFQVYISEMILLSKFYVIIISHVFIKKFILYSNHFKHIGLFVSIFIAIILLNIYAVRSYLYA